MNVQWHCRIFFFFLFGKLQSHRMLAKERYFYVSFMSDLFQSCATPYVKIQHMQINKHGKQQHKVDKGSLLELRDDEIHMKWHENLSRPDQTAIIWLWEFELTHLDLPPILNVFVLVYLDILDNLIFFSFLHACVLKKMLMIICTCMFVKKSSKWTDTCLSRFLDYPIFKVHNLSWKVTVHKIGSILMPSSVLSKAKVLEKVINWENCEILLARSQNHC